MINKEELKQFFYKNVDIAVPHRFRAGEFFWFSGEIVSISDKFIGLRKDPDKSLILINLDRIQEIRSSFKQKYRGGR